MQVNGFKTKGYVQREVAGSILLEDLWIKGDLAPQEALVETFASGICHSDVSSMKDVLGPYPRPAVFGHEGCGTIVALGTNVSGFKLGDKVITAW